MSTLDKSALLITNNDALAQRCQQAVGEVFGKKIIVANNMSTAQSKFENQSFDCVLLALNEAVLSKHQVFFKNTQKYLGKSKRTPWILLIEGVEEAEVVLAGPHIIKTLPQDWSDEDLQTLVRNLFVNEQSNDRSSIMNVQFINPFIEAISNVLSSMSQITITAEAPSLKRSGNQSSNKGDISGIIPVSSDTFSGSMAIVLPKSLALKIYENMLGEDKAEIDSEVKDCIMEITNIVFGNAKRDLNKIGHTIRPALPSVITGNNHELYHSQEGLILSVPFKSDYGNFALECLVSMSDTKN